MRRSKILREFGLNLIVSNTKDTKEHKKDAEINRKRQRIEVAVCRQGL